MSEGRELTQCLIQDINDIIFDYNWTPHGVVPNTIIRLVEVKSHLINAEAKLQHILEGIDEA